MLTNLTFSSLAYSLFRTGKWSPSLPSDIKRWLVQRTAGYCGADMKALCAEAALVALRRAFPQVYDSASRLSLPTAALQLKIGDFEAALQKLVPASQRSTGRAACALDATMLSLLEKPYLTAIRQLASDFPPGREALLRQLKDGPHSVPTSTVAFLPTAAESNRGAECTQHEINFRDSIAAYEALATSDEETWAAGMADTRSVASGAPRTTYNPRLLLQGPAGSGQAEVASAVLACLEGIPCYAVSVGRTNFVISHSQQTTKPSAQRSSANLTFNFSLC